MNIVERIENDEHLSELSIRSDSVVRLGGIIPVTATPAALGAGVAAGAGLVGAAAGGAALGEAID